MPIKIAAAALLLAAVAIVGYWVATGAHAFTQTQVLQSVESEDPVTGEKVTTQAWVDDYQLGGLDRALPTAGALTALAVGLWWWQRRRTRVPG